MIRRISLFSSRLLIIPFWNAIFGEQTAVIAFNYWPLIGKRWTVGHALNARYLWIVSEKWINCCIERKHDNMAAQFVHSAVGSMPKQIRNDLKVSISSLHTHSSEMSFAYKSKHNYYYYLTFGDLFLFLVRPIVYASYNILIKRNLLTDFLRSGEKKKYDKYLAEFFAVRTNI